VNVRLNAEHSITGSGGFASGGTAGAGAGTFTITSAGLNGGAAVNVAIATTDTIAEAVTKTNAALAAATGGAAGFVAENASGQLKIRNTNNASFAIGGTTTGTGLGAASAETATTPKTVDELVTLVNANAGLTGKVKASNDGGKLRIENQSTEALSVVGASATAVTGATGASATQTIAGNDVRKGLISQFNELRNQLDKLAGDASYNGVNLVKADKLKITFNETGTSTLDIQAKNTAGTVRGIGTESSSLDIGAATAAEFDSDAALDARLEKLSNALTTVQTQSGEFGAALTTVQNRQEFTKAMINTLQTGADNLTLADSNEEAAKLLSLNTRQQLSQTALSLASQADQAVLRLF
jgi:flagellin